MAEQQLVDYIQKAKGAGQTDEQIKASLSQNGWTEAEITDALSVINQTQIKPQPKKAKTENNKLSVNDPVTIADVIPKPNMINSTL